MYQRNVLFPAHLENIVFYIERFIIVFDVSLYKLILNCNYYINKFIMEEQMLLSGYNIYK